MSKWVLDLLREEIVALLSTVVYIHMHMCIDLYRRLLPLPIAVVYIHMYMCIGLYRRLLPLPIAVIYIHMYMCIGLCLLLPPKSTYTCVCVCLLHMYTSVEYIRQGKNLKS